MSIKREINQGTLLAGVVLILIGIVFLLINFNLIGGEAFLIALGAAFLVAFVLTRNLGFLIPGMILFWLGIAVTIIEQDLFPAIDDGSFVLVALGLAFLLIFAFMPRRHWWPLIPGGILLFIGIMITLEDFLPFSFGQLMAFFWPALLIVIGLWLVIRQLLRR